MNKWIVALIIMCIAEVTSRHISNKRKWRNKISKRYAVPDLPSFVQSSGVKKVKSYPVPQLPYPVPTLKRSTSTTTSTSTSKSTSTSTLTPYPIPTLPMFANFALMNGSKVAVCPLNRNKRAALSHDELRQLLEYHGGSFNPRVMAATRNDAKRHFHNMLPLPLTDMEGDSTESSIKSEIITKEQIKTDIHKWNIYLHSLVVSSFEQKQENLSYSVGNLTFIVKSFLQETKDRLNLKQKDFVQKLGDYILKHMSAGQLIEIIKASNITVHPDILQSLSTREKKRKRDTGGAKVELQYCINKGEQQPGGFLGLCSACAVTTTLAKDKFPRHINEVICKGGDRSCINMQNAPHGACKETSLQMTFLRRVPGGCRMMIKNQKEMMVHEWETYIQPVRTGCACFLDRRSKLAPYFFPQIVG